MDVGSFLSIFSFIFYIVFSPISFVIMYSFITAIIKLIMKKYTEAEHMNLIEKMVKKFKLIQEALDEKKDDPAFKSIYDDVSYMVNMDVSKLSFTKIEEVHHEMKIMEKKLPDVSDLEGMI